MSNTSGQLLRLENVSKKYKKNIVLDNISFSVNRVFLITALMIIPAAAALTVSNIPLQMIIFASICVILSVVGVIFSSSQWDVPTGPAIVLSATVLFLCGRFLLRAKS